MANSIEQYIRIFDEHSATISAHAPEVLNRNRKTALDYLRLLSRMPECGDEGFPNVSLNEMFAPDYGLNITRVDFGKPAGDDRCGQSVAGRPAAMIVNDAFVDCGTALPEGVEVCSIAEGARRHPELFEHSIAPVENTVAALNALLVQDGVFIFVCAGVHVVKPLQILSMFNSAIPMMGVRRVRIHIADGASASVMMCDHPVEGSANHLACRVVEASVGRNASLRFYDLEEAADNSSRASVFASEQCEGSSLKVCSLFLNGGITRNEFYPRHLAERCTTFLGGLVIGCRTQHIDNFVALNHEYPRCCSEQLFKYALFDNARGSFEGMVMVSKGAIHTEARQSNRNLLASEGARMYAMPQLEIYCDDVKASHGSATGQIDERALFYMRQRGIPESEARMMLVNAFMTDVLDTIDDEPLRERLRHLVDLRLRGAETVCASCK